MVGYEEGRIEKKNEGELFLIWGTRVVEEQTAEGMGIGLEWGPGGEEE